MRPHITAVAWRRYLGQLERAVLGAAMSAVVLVAEGQIRRRMSSGKATPGSTETSPRGTGATV